MERVKVSVIVSLFNKRKYVKRALLSVANQTYKNLEIIVVDDASTDDSYKLALEIFSSDQRFIFMKNEVNRGQAKTLNIGVERSTGEIISFLDADFFWSLEHIERVVEKYTAYPDVGLIYSHIINHKYKKIEGPDVYGDVVSNGHLCSTSCISLIAEKFKKVGGVPNLLNVDDEVCFLMAKMFEVRLVDEETVVYVRNPDSLTNNISFVCDYKLELSEKYKHDILKYGGASVYAGHLYKVSLIALTNGLYKKGFKCLLMAVRANIDLLQIVKIISYLFMRNRLSLGSWFVALKKKKVK